MNHIQNHDTLRAMNQALRKKHGHERTMAAIQAALKAHKSPSLGHLPYDKLDSVYAATRRLLGEL